MDALKAIVSRRSIRKYTAEAVGDPCVRKVIEAGMYAPSAGNQQPWHFIVIRNKQTLLTIPQYHPHAQMLKEAGVAVLVCGDLSLEKHKGYWVQDCSAAVENMLLAAHAQGISAVWLGIYPREDRVAGLRKLLGIPEQVVPFALVPLGYAAEKKEAEDRFKKERVHEEKW